MKRVLCLASVVVVLAGGLVTAAEEPPEMQLEFVKKLRARKMSGLALEYLEKLQKNPPPGLAEVLPLEIARTKVGLAQEKDPAQRLALFDEARKELQAFLVKAGTKPESAQIRLEMARLTNLQGQALLTQAFRQEDDEAAREFAKRAENVFVQARTELGEASKAIEKLHQTYTNSSSEKEKLYKKQLAADLQQAHFEQAKTYFEQARTYLDLDASKERLKRAELVAAGNKALEGMARDEDINPEVSYLAWAWLIRGSYLNEEPTKAKDYYNRLSKVTSEEATPAKRWGKLFHMQGIYKDPAVKPAPGKSKAQLVEDLAHSWLKEFPAARNTPEGFAVRFELGAALYKQASALEAKSKEKGADKKTLEKRAHTTFEEAKQVFSGIAESESELSEKANQLTLDISFRLMGEDSPVEKLKDFGECFLKARLELTRFQKVNKQLAEAPNPELKKKLDETRKTHLNGMIAAFRRALQLATPKTPPSRIEEVKFFLTFAYLLSGDPYRAAVMGEHLAESDPPGRRAALGAGYAMQAYLAILNKDRAANKGKATESKEPLQRLLGFILHDREKEWRSEPVYALARYQVALQFIDLYKYQQAIAELEKLPTDFSAYFYTRCQLGLLALAGARNAEKDEDKAAFRQKGLAVLRQFNKLPANVDLATAIMFAQAQVELGKVLYEDATRNLLEKKLPEAAKQYQDLVTSAKSVWDQIKVVPGDSKDLLDRYEQSFKDLQGFGRFGLANCEYQKGNYAGTLKSLQGAVEAQSKPKAYVVSNPGLATLALGLQLRACVWNGDLKTAETTLTNLQQLQDATGQPVETGDAQRSILGELQVKLKDLRKEKDQAKLKAAVKNFSSFLELLIKGSGEKLGRGETIFLAKCFDSLDQHRKAADLYAKVQPPTPPREGAKEEEQKAFEKEEQAYWFMRVLYGRQLRLAQDSKEAKKVLDEVLASPKAAGKLLAQKELIHLLQDQQLYGTCITKWGDFMQNPGLKGQLAKGDPKAKELYFESFFHFVECWYRYSQSPKVKGTPNEERYLQRAADYLVRLEQAAGGGGWVIIEPQVTALLQAEPPLRQMYDRLKKERTEK